MGRISEHKRTQAISQWRTVFSVPVIVAALGYFVDIYDLVLFSIVRVPSLKSIGLQGQALLDEGVFLLNMQMAGMLIGGVIWGILGDKKGRLKILFGSIFLYSVANIANGMVATMEWYSVWRFIAGVGLAGELGAGITLVTEVLPKHLRGYGTMVVASVGVSGAILANYLAKLFDWRVAFFIGGGLGLLLLFLRMGVYESGMFRQVEKSPVKRGNFLKIFSNRRMLFKYANSILIGIPIWFVVGILITFSPEFANALGVIGAVNAGNAVMFCYLGLILGDFSSGLLSQLWKSRKKAVLFFQLMTAVFIIFYFNLSGATSEVFYAVCVLLGFAIGYWAMFVTIAAEQFGTNLRATVATTVPNFVRGSVVPVTFLFQFAKSKLGILNGATVIAVLCLLVAFYALWRLEETFHKDLDYIELS
ncbi:MAG: MFS transporter [Nitrospirae bacterium]|nr:MAG: MFS transporter [Nitrospirota bacterium]